MYFSLVKRSAAWFRGGVWPIGFDAEAEAMREPLGTETQVCYSGNTPPHALGANVMNCLYSVS